MPVNRNKRVAAICAGVVLSMGALAYAAVPLYRMFCQVTGFAGTTQRVTAASSEVLERKITVRFDANVAPGLEWDFKPLVNTMSLKIGENALVVYRVTNRSSTPAVGTATFNVTPDQAGAFFNKIACFCFNEQRVEPGESVDMPVSFFVDPSIVKDTDGAHIRLITLSYTFHPVKSPKSAGLAESAKPVGPHENAKPAPPSGRPAPRG